jgi:hypothetical protein
LGKFIGDAVLVFFGDPETKVVTGRCGGLHVDGAEKNLPASCQVSNVAQSTEHYRPKSHNSEGDVLVDPELMEVFRGYHAGRKGEFVIESDSPPPPFDAPYGVTIQC